MTPLPLAIHEAAHAVVGICVGWSGYLEKVSIASNEHRKGGCHWRDYDKRVKSGDEEVAVGLAGPIGQVLYAPESIGADLALFDASIQQPPDIVNRSKLAGWYGSEGWDGDLSPFRFREWVRGKGFPAKFSYDAPLEQIEARTRELLKRPTVGAAIQELAGRLLAEQEVAGADAETIIKRNLATDDYVNAEFFTKG